MPSTALYFALVLFLLVKATASFAETRTLNFTLPKEADAFVRQIASEFADELEKQSGGALKVDLGQKQQTYKDNEIVSAASSGAIEIAGTTLNQFAYDVPLAGVFLQPFMFNFNALVRAAATPGSDIRTLVDDEILYWTNTRVLWWQPNGSSVILARRIPDDVAAIADLAVGSPDDQSKELTRACGGQAYLIATGDLRAALQNASIQLAMTDILAVKAQSLWDAAEAIVNTRHAPSLYIVVINDRLWQSLAPGEQELLKKVAQNLQERTWDRFLQVEAEAYAMAREKGMKIYDLMAGDIESWRACSSPLLEAYMERIGEPGQKLFAAYGKLRTEPCCRQAPEAEAASSPAASVQR
jgi:C4-dicarboxylate-binding protein DctP